MADRDMNSIKFPGLPDRYKFLRLDPTLTQSGKAADAKEVGDRLASMNDNVSEIAAEGTVPTSEQMLSDNYTEDSVPYHFRKTASDNANREEIEIVGGSVAWNQLFPNMSEQATLGWSVLGNVTSRENLQNGVLVTWSGVGNDANGSRVYSASNILTTGHKYFVSCEITNSYDSTASIGRTAGNIVTKTIAKNTQTVVSGIIDVTSDGAMWICVDRSLAITSGATTTIKNVMAIDLTAMFGSTIADHIYSLEQATAGAGAALFKSLFPKDYYPYDAGSMQSVSGLSEHKTVGFNQWDEEWEVGAYNASTGAKVANSNCIRSKNLIPVVPNTRYFINASYAVSCCYDANGNYLCSTPYAYPPMAGAYYIDIPSGARYITFNMPNSYGTTYNHDICINISDPAKNGTYEPYDGHSYALDDSLTLRGFPTLVDGKIEFDGDIYSPSGKVTRRYGIVDLGTLNWNVYSGDTSGHSFYVNVPSGCKPVASDDAVANIIAAIYKTIAFVNVATFTADDKVVCQVKNADRFIIRDSGYSEAGAFKTAMSGVYLVYPLATPTTEQADPYIGIQSCDPNGTEEFVSTGIVPVGHNTKYPDNMRAKLDGLPWNFASLIAPTESGFKATRNYTTGALLIVNNVLYKATANIANGGTITVGTNVTATTLAEVIAALS